MKLNPLGGVTGFAVDGDLLVDKYLKKMKITAARYRLYISDEKTYVHLCLDSRRHDAIPVITFVYENKKWQRRKDDGCEQYSKALSPLWIKEADQILQELKDKKVLR